MKHIRGHFVKIIIRSEDKKIDNVFLRKKIILFHVCERIKLIYIHNLRMRLF